jgi:hypothetical protein
MATLNRGASDVLNKHVTKVRDDPVETTAVDQAESRFQLQVFAAKVSDFKDWCVGVAGAEATAVLNGRSAVVKSENGKTLVSQPPANLTVPAPQVDDALIFREPAGVDGFKKFLLGSSVFQNGLNSGFCH